MTGGVRPAAGRTGDGLRPSLSNGATVRDSQNASALVGECAKQAAVAGELVRAAHVLGAWVQCMPSGLLGPAPPGIMDVSLVNRVPPHLVDDEHLDLLENIGQFGHRLGHLVDGLLTLLAHVLLDNNLEHLLRVEALHGRQKTNTVATALLGAGWRARPHPLHPRHKQRPESQSADAPVPLRGNRVANPPATPLRRARPAHSREY
eukprot:scaffold5793_cov105-Isochrysis_galbana.AAC.6